METPKLGHLITADAQRDAIHIAVMPCTADEVLLPGGCVYIIDGKARSIAGGGVGVVDPFLNVKSVMKGERFWLMLYPGSITSLRHDWTHPKIDGVDTVEEDVTKSEAVKWMKKWAKDNICTEHRAYDDKELPVDMAYEYAIDAGEYLNIGRYEDARESINDEWWDKWEIITGKQGKRGEYFRCAC